MSFLHSSILYIHFKTLSKILYLQCFKNFGIKRFIWTISFLLLLIVVTSIILTFRLLDEIFFFNYRKVDVEKPIFIISNPRSGTTFMHRLMCMDEGKYGYTYLYHTIFPSITIFKIIDFFGKIDRRIGYPFRAFFKFLDKLFFSAWENIHPMGFGKTEEDEAVYIFTGMSGGMIFLCPYIKDIYDVVFPDKLPDSSRKRIMNFYTNSIKRVMYASGNDKIFLSKNVMSTGRVFSLQEAYPDARYIYLVRNPINTIPSLISMFSVPWTAHSPDIKPDSPEYRAWGEIGMEYYKYFDKFKDTVAPKNMAIIKYDDLVANPKKTIESIYDKFDLTIDDSYAEKLSAISQRQKSYKSTHSYSLSDYGMTEEQVQEELAPIFKKYGFSISEG